MENPELDDDLFKEEDIAEWEKDCLLNNTASAFDATLNLEAEKLSPNDTPPSKEHLDTLHKWFGHKTFRPMQWKIINSIMNDRRDNCAVMTTGYGKSLCYQFPSIYMGGITLVISPLISLMEDQVLSLQIANIPACLLGTAQSQQAKIMQEIFEDKYCLIYLTPEFALGDAGLDFLNNLQEKFSITLLAVDEAHCVSSWGHDFRLKYRELGKLRDVLRNVPILAVTATATPSVRNDISKSLRLQNPQMLCSSFDRPNLYLEVRMKGQSGVFADLCSVMEKKGIKYSFSGSTIIYCLTKKTTDELAELLNSNGIECLPYHAGLSLKQRKEAHEKFVRDNVKIIVATIAFGMGIDKPDVRCVIHYGAPSSLEGYYQEIGRAGRDGLPAKCIAFYSHSDSFIHDQLRELSFGGEKVKEHKKEMLALTQKYLKHRDCRREYILNHFHEKITKTERKNCCDNCTREITHGKDSDKYAGIDENECYDFTQDFTTFLNAVSVMGGKFGYTMYIDFLRGSQCAKLYDRFKQHALHGSGLSQTKEWWKAIGSLLESHNYLTKQSLKKGKFTTFTIGLSPKGETFLRNANSNPGREKIKLKPPQDILAHLKIKTLPKRTIESTSQETIPRVPQILTNFKPMSGQNATTSKTFQIQPETPEKIAERQLEERKKLYRLLLNKRATLATAKNCMPYAILSNMALLELARLKPTTLQKLRDCNIDGINEAILIQFGKEFVSIIRSFYPDDEDITEKKLSIRDILIENPLPSTKLGLSAENSYTMFKGGKTIKEISEARGVLPQTIMSHLVDAMKAGYPVKLIDLGVTDEIREIVLKAVSEVECGFNTMLPIKNICPPHITFDQIRAVCAHLQVRDHLKKINANYIEYEDFVNESTNIENTERQNNTIISAGTSSSSNTTIIVADDGERNDNLDELLKIYNEQCAQELESFKMKKLSPSESEEPPVKKAKLDNTTDELLMGSPPRESQDDLDSTTSTIIIDQDNISPTRSPLLNNNGANKVPTEQVNAPTKEVSESPVKVYKKKTANLPPWLKAKRLA